MYQGKMIETEHMTYNERLSKCLEAIKRGDQTKYQELHEMTFGPLINVAKMYLIDNSHAKAVVLDLYYKIYLYADRYDASKDALSYLWQITKNIAFDYNKRYKKDNWISIEELQIADAIDPYDIVNARIDIQRALSRVRMRDRLIIIWTFRYRLTQEEIGNRLGITKSAVNQRLKKTLNKLREYLK